MEKISFSSKEVNQKKNINEIMQNIISEAEKIEIKTEDRDINGNLLVYPNGPISNLKNELYWRMVRTNAFKEWFGDWKNNPESAGKIVDENGEPIVVYHASKEAFDEFDPDKGSHLKVLGKGSYFELDFDPTDTQYNYYGELHYSCFLNIKNKIHIPEKGGFLKKNMFKTFYFSLVRPQNSALYDYNEEINSKHSNATKYKMSQISVLHKENIMIIPNTRKEKPIIPTK
jgi:hypothetical protein